MSPAAIKSFVGLVFLALSSALSAQTPVAVVAFERVDPSSPEGTIWAGLEMAHQAGQPDRFKVKADLFLRNNTSVNKTVTSVRVSYPNTLILAVDSILPGDPQVLPANDVGRVRVFDGIARDLVAPAPSTIRIRVNFTDGTAFQRDFPLAMYPAAVAAGVNLFPALQSDLDTVAPGAYWAYGGSRHIDDADSDPSNGFQPSTVRDRYAYDLVAMRWDGTKWTNLVEGASSSVPNENHLVFGLPLYATGDGVIVECTNGVVDPDGSSSGPGNELWIQYGDQMVRLTHLQFGSIPSRLCPFTDKTSHYVEAQNITVRAGERVGRVGNTGQSSGPHLHMSVVYRPVTGVEPDLGSFDSEDASSVPQGFHNVSMASDNETVNDLGANPALRPMAGQMFPSHTLFQPNDCGLDAPSPGATELTRRGLSSACVGPQFNMDTAAGYRPVFVEGFDVSNVLFSVVRYNLSYRSGGRAPSGNLTQLALTDTQLQDLIDELEPQGWRIHSLDSHKVGSEVRYNVIFNTRSGAPDWAAYHGLSASEHTTRMSQLRAAGFVPVQVSVVDFGIVGNPSRWTALYEAQPFPDWELVNATTTSFQDAFNAQTEAGRMLTSLHGHRVGDTATTRLVGVFVNAPGSAWTASTGLTATAHQTATGQNTGAGRLTRVVAGYDDNGAARYAGIWRSAVNTTLTQQPPPTVTDSRDVTVAWSPDDPFATGQCQLTPPLFAVYATCASPKTYTGLADGSYTIRVRSIDRDGVTEPTSAASVSFTVDVPDPDADTDGDGLPDAWETANGLDPNNPNDATLDADGDGLSNLDEFNADTDPNDPDSDGDGIGDGVDAAPTAPSNVCSGADAVFENTLVLGGTVVQCAAGNSVRVRSTVTIEPGGRVELYTPQTHVEPGFTLPSGAEFVVTPHGTP